VVIPIIEKRRRGLGEERGGAETTVSLCEDDFIKQADSRVFWTEGFAFVNEFIESWSNMSASCYDKLDGLIHTLRLSEHLHIL
jgi:hypothetical protein